jgi:hypothetical protein
VDLDVVEIAFHRFIAVVFGVVFGVLIQTWIWPFEARRELRKELSTFFLNASYLYERLVRIYSAPPTSLSRSVSTSISPTERTSLLKEARQDLDEAAEDFVAMEVELQLLLIKVRSQPPPLFLSRADLYLPVDFGTSRRNETRTSTQRTLSCRSLQSHSRLLSDNPRLSHRCRKDDQPFELVLGDSTRFRDSREQGEKGNGTLFPSFPVVAAPSVLQVTTSNFPNLNLGRQHHPLLLDSFLRRFVKDAPSRRA